MKYYKVSIIICSFFMAGSHLATGQEFLDINGPRIIVKSQELPRDLTATRSAVIISMDVNLGEFITRNNWELLAQKVHSSLRKMSIDGICYLYRDDLLAGPEITSAFIKELKQRGVKNLVFFDQYKDGLRDYYALKILPFNEKDNMFDDNEKTWMEENEDFDRIILRLGRQILQQDLPRTNFLIPESPNIIKDIPIFTGIQLSNYPGQLRRATLGIVVPSKIDEPTTMNESGKSKIQQYNQSIDEKIAEMESILQKYPFKYQIINYQEDDQLYKSGFQFVLMPLNSTGKTLKNLLNYKISGNETDYISIVPKESGGVHLKTIPVDAIVYKYYIKQTIAHDAHVGNQWDSDTTWQTSLQNFILNLKDALK